MVLFIAVVAAAAAAAFNISTLFNHHPFVTAHDAATGYLQSGGIVKEQLIRWTKTQAGTPAAMLGCGARAFDWRPQAVGSKLVMHHGDVVVDHLMSSAL